MKRLRYGFTLVELLVVIAIIAILVLMLLPAINAMRESARRTQCVNRMSQLIVGVHSHEMAHGYYPMGVRSKSGPIVSQEQGFHHSWTIPLLPFIEEDNVYRMIDHEKSVYAKNNRPARDTHLSSLICPSSTLLSDAIGHSNYAAVHHDVEAPIDYDNQGVFFLNSRMSQDDVTDGTRYTMFLGEKILERGDLGWMSGTRATLRNAGTPINRTDLQAKGWTGLSKEFLDDYESQSEAGFVENEDVLVSEDDDAPMQDRDDEDEGGEEDSGENDQLNDDDAQEEVPQADVDEVDDEAEIEEGGVDEVATDDPPEAADTKTAESTEAESQDPWADAKKKGLFVGGFGSFHKGGGVFAFGDGHVRFINNDIDFQVYQHMAGRADGKVIDGRVLD